MSTDDTAAPETPCAGWRFAYTTPEGRFEVGCEVERGTRTVTGWPSGTLVTVPTVYARPILPTREQASHGQSEFAAVLAAATRYVQGVTDVRGVEVLPPGPVPRVADDATLDGTDAAHPAWWRGHDAGAKGMTAALEEARAEVRRLQPLAAQAPGLAAERDHYRERAAANHKRADEEAHARALATADAKRLREREDYFAHALGVADGGQYRADWPGALERLLRERAELAARVEGLTRAVDKASAAMRALLDDRARYAAGALPTSEDLRVQSAAFGDCDDQTPEWIVATEGGIMLARGRSVNAAGDLTDDEPGETWDLRDLDGEKILDTLVAAWPLDTRTGGPGAWRRPARPRAFTSRPVHDAVEWLLPKLLQETGPWAAPEEGEEAGGAVG